MNGYYQYERSKNRTIRKTREVEMEKKILLFLVLMLTGCASTGAIKGLTFIDRKYPVEIKFPDGYTLVTVATNEFAWRIAAVKGLGKARGYYKPTIIVAIMPADTTFYGFIETTKEWHYDIKTMIWENLDIEEEEDILVENNVVHVVYFAGSGLRGINAYREFGKYHAKIEYISAYDYYDKNDMMYILKNMSVR
jgi:hypothetical protein